jgi:hypothetical protein
MHKPVATGGFTARLAFVAYLAYIAAHPTGGFMRFLFQGSAPVAGLMTSPNIRRGSTGEHLPNGTS